MTHERFQRYKLRTRKPPFMLTDKEFKRYAKAGNEIHEWLQEHFNTPREAYFVLVTLKRYFEKLYGFVDPTEKPQ